MKYELSRCLSNITKDKNLDIILIWCDISNSMIFMSKEYSRLLSEEKKVQFLISSESL